MAIMGLAFAVNASAAQEGQRCITIELYLRGSDAPSVSLKRTAENFVNGRAGVRLVTRDLDQEPDAKGRLDKIADYFQLKQPASPFFYGCRQFVMGPTTDDELKGRLASMLRMDVYIRGSCPRCAAAKDYLAQLMRPYPGFQLVYHDVETSGQASADLQEVVRRHKTAATSVPVFHFCNQVVIGFDSPSSTGPRLERILEHWTSPCPKQERPATKSQQSDGRPARPSLPEILRGTAMLLSPSIAMQTLVGQEVAGGAVAPAPLPIPGDDPPRPGDDPPRPGDDSSSLPLPGDSPGSLDDDSVDLPVFGRLYAHEVGLPAFTIAIGLVDGFNPCAMWVLLFLLSVLVNLQSRLKILAVAGTFVLISGLAYFAFMAAWLNVFLFIGLVRWVQVALGTLAILIGSIHVKDFFAFHQGISLSIPESVKPGIYARVRRIVMAESLIGAIVGSAVLAVLVNMIELLCTAGLPALYTNVLAMQQLPAWKNYLYLGLYNVAYMFDDSVMVALVTITLGRRKLHETQGRWLKLISGLAVLALGVILIAKPELLL